MAGLPARGQGGIRRVTDTLGGWEWEEGALAVPPTTPVTPCPREGVTRDWGSSRGAGGDTSSSRAGRAHWMEEVREGVWVCTRLVVTRVPLYT